MTPLTMHPLRRYRKLNRLSLEEVAEALGTSIATLSRIENGTQGVTRELAKRIEEFTHGQASRMDLLYPEEFLKERVVADSGRYRI